MEQGEIGNSGLSKFSYFFFRILLTWFIIIIILYSVGVNYFYNPVRSSKRQDTGRMGRRCRVGACPYGVGIKGL